MRERWRLFRDDPAPAIFRHGWQIALYTGRTSCTVGVEVEPKKYLTTLTLRLPFVHVVCEWWPL